MHVPVHIEVALLADFLLYPVYPAVVEFEYPAAFQAFHMVVMQVSERMFIADMPIFGKRCPYQACLNKMPPGRFWTGDQTHSAPDCLITAN